MQGYMTNELDKQRGILKTLLSNSDVLNIKVYNVFNLEKLPSMEFCQERCYDVLTALK